jgi:hypothetical protein
MFSDVDRISSGGLPTAGTQGGLYPFLQQCAARLDHSEGISSLLHFIDPKKDLPNGLKFIPIHEQPASPRSLARSTTASIATGTPATP